MTLAGERGVALVVTLMALLLLAGLGLALVMTTGIEAAIAGNYRLSREARYAAEAALGRVLVELRTAPDWNPVVAGLVVSAFTDGPAGGVRILADGSRLDLTAATRLINCGAVSACAPADMDAATESRPWGVNNPRWQLYAHAPIARLVAGGAVRSPFYTVVWVGDDPAENDGDPTRDGEVPDNPGAGIVALRADAFGPGGSHSAVEATVGRRRPDAAGATAGPGLRILSWRAVR